MTHHVVVVVQQPLDRVCNFELPAQRGPNFSDSFVNLRGKKVDAHKSKVGNRRLGLFDKPYDAALLIDLGDPKIGRRIYLLKQDRGICFRLLEISPKFRNARADKVIAKIHNERRSEEHTSELQSQSN